MNFIKNFSASSDAIIFDLDKTLIYCDLPIEVVKTIYTDHPKKYKILKNIKSLILKIPSSRLRRKFEYFELAWLPIKDVKRTMNEIFYKNLNYNIFENLKYYHNYGYLVLIVTAGPQKYLMSIENELKVKLIGSSIFAGIITKDLQGKKEKLYKKLVSNEIRINAIFSDQLCDLSSLSQMNYLVHENGTHDIIHL